MSSTRHLGSRSNKKKHLPSRRKLHFIFCIPSSTSSPSSPSFLQALKALHKLQKLSAVEAMEGSAKGWWGR